MEKELIKDEKSRLRKKIKSELAVFMADTKKRTDAEKKAASVFLSSSYYKNSSFILCFISAENEIPTVQIIEKALRDNKTVAVPRVRSDSGSECQMDFYFLENKPVDEQTEKGAFGISEPLPSLKIVQVSQIPENSLMVLPGLGFTADGKRLGKGKGFYDRYITELSAENTQFGMSCKKIGYCFNFQVRDNIPVDEHDMKVDVVITENGIY